MESGDVIWIGVCCGMRHGAIRGSGGGVMHDVMCWDVECGGVLMCDVECYVKHGSGMWNSV